MKYLYSIVATVATLIASAQNMPSIPIGVIQNGESHTLATAPTTTIIIDMTLLHSEFRSGVYARYAQKYLGERASLTNREATNIERATIAIASKEHKYAPKEHSAPELITISPAQSLPIDRTSAEVMIPEQAAQDVANKIFANRKLCNDLIAGDVGEGVFGAGLATALDRFDRLEREYLSLFMGVESKTTTTKRFTIDVTPQKKRYMIGRYDPQKGLLPTGGIDGEPVYLQITPSEVKDSTHYVTAGKTPKREIFITPNQAQCDLYVGAEIITSTQLPIYEFGARDIIVYNHK